MHRRDAAKAAPLAEREPLVQRGACGAVAPDPPDPRDTLLDAALRPVEAHPHRAGVSHAAELVDPAGAAVGHAKEGALVAEDVSPLVYIRSVETVRVPIDEPLAGDVLGVGARHGHDLAGRVRRVMHRRAAGD